jgi:hypothetical protein
MHYYRYMDVLNRCKANIFSKIQIIKKKAFVVNYYLESLKITKSGCRGFQFVLNLQLSF